MREPPNFLERFKRSQPNPRTTLTIDEALGDDRGVVPLLLLDSPIARGHFEAIGLHAYLREAQAILRRLPNFRAISLGLTMEDMSGVPDEGQLAAASFIWKPTRESETDSGLGSFVLYHPKRERVVVSGIRSIILSSSRTNEIKNAIARSFHHPHTI